MLQLDDEGSIFYSTAPNWVNSSSIPKEEKPITGEIETFILKIK